MSTGLVFTSGRTDGADAWPKASFGVIGGAALTESFRHETTGFIISPGGGVEPLRSRAYSPLKDYVIGL